MKTETELLENEIITQPIFELIQYDNEGNPQLNPLVSYTQSFLSTYFTKDNEIEWCDNNLIPNSEDLNSWTNQNCNIQLVSSDYEGNYNSWLVSTNLSNSFKGIYASSSSKYYRHIISIDAKANSANWIGITSYTESLANANGAYFNLSTGEIGAVSPSYNATMISKGNGWFTCSLTSKEYSLDNVRTIFLMVRPHTNNLQNYTWIPSENVSIFIAKPQLESVLNKKEPSKYFPTNGNPYFGPRMTYSTSTGEFEGFLTEQYVTNYNRIQNNICLGTANGSPGIMPIQWAETISQANLTRTIITGKENGMPYVDFQFQGIANVSTLKTIQFAPYLEVLANTDERVTFSTYLKIPKGSVQNTTIQLRLFQRDSNGIGINQTFTHDITQILKESVPTVNLSSQRYVISEIMQANCKYVTPYVAFYANANSYIDITLRLSLPQAQKYFLCSPIITAGPTGFNYVQLTERANVTNSNFSKIWKPTNGITIETESAMYGTKHMYDFQVIHSLFTGNVANALSYTYYNSTIKSFVSTGFNQNSSKYYHNLYYPNANTNSFIKRAFSITPNSSLSWSGAAQTVSTTSINTNYFNPTSLYFAISPNNSTPSNIIIKKFNIYNRAVSNSELFNMTVTPIERYDESSIKYFNTMKKQPTEFVKKAIDTYIKELKKYRIWEKLDGGNILCLEDLEQCLVDFKNPLRIATLAPGFTATFTPYLGFTGLGKNANEQTDYIDTNFIPSIHGINLEKDSAHFSVFQTNSVKSNRVLAGANSPVSNTSDITIVTRNFSDQLLLKLNSHTFDTIEGINDYGFNILNRIDSNNVSVYLNNNKLRNVTRLSEKLSENSIRYIQVNQSSGSLNQRIGFASYGASFSESEVFVFNRITQNLITYLNSL